VEVQWTSTGLPLEFTGVHWSPLESVEQRKVLPKHPDWLTVVRPPTNNEAPRVLAYVHNRLTQLRPSLCQDLIDHRDILILSLFSEGRTINIMNVYSDDQHTAINLLAECVPTLPACVLMTGDFNCHSREWDPLVLHH